MDDSQKLLVSDVFLEYPRLLGRKDSDQLDRFSSRLQLQTLPFRQWLQEISDEQFMACFEESKAFQEDKFSLEQTRALAKIKLSPAEEELLV